MATGDPVVDMLLVLVKAGATPASAARAAAMLHNGASIREAQRVLVLAVQPVASFDAQLLAAQAARRLVAVPRAL